jgi:tetratricopeptide (TPR) repeat protein
MPLEPDKTTQTAQADANPAATPSPTPLLYVWLVSIALAVVTLGIYAQVLQFDFVDWDDDQYIYENPHTAQGLTVPSVTWAFTSTDAVNWHPLTWISHMVDVELFGLQRAENGRVLQGPGGHHLVSVLLHTANSLLLLLLLVRMTGAFWPSALCAALFAIHPLRVESVAWVSERKDVLSGFFFMLTLLAYHRYTQRATLRRYLLVFISLALGLMAKPMLVTVPFVLLLLDLWPLRRWALPGWPPRRLLLEKLPLLGLAFASCLVTMLAQQAGGAVSSLDNLPLSWRLINAPIATATYLVKTVWPTHLTYLYAHPAEIPNKSLGDWIMPAAAATLFLLLVSVFFLLLSRKRPYLVVGWLWFLGMLLPVIGLVQVGNQAWADRYTYLPLIGVYLVFSWSLAQWIQGRPALRRKAIVAVTAIFLLLIPLTWWQITVWRDSKSLYTHALSVTKSNYIAHTNLGAALHETGHFDASIVQYQQALRIKPDYAEAHNSWGSALTESGHPEEALEHYREALRIKPDYAEAHSNLGVALTKLGRPREGVTHYHEALRLKPDYAEAHYSWATALQAAGQFEQAIEQHQQALRLRPNYAEAHNNLGIALAESGQPRQAVEHYEEALRIEPNYAAAHNNWGNALQALESLHDAIAHYRQALQIRPDYADAHNNLGVALARNGQLADALKHFEQAVTFDPNFEEAQRNTRKIRARLHGE